MRARVHAEYCVNLLILGWILEVKLITCGNINIFFCIERYMKTFTQGSFSVSGLDS